MEFAVSWVAKAQLRHRLPRSVAAVPWGRTGLRCAPIRGWLLSPPAATARRRMASTAPGGKTAVMGASGGGGRPVARSVAGGGSPTAGGMARASTVSPPRRLAVR